MAVSISLLYYWRNESFLVNSALFCLSGLSQIYDFFRLWKGSLVYLFASTTHFDGSVGSGMMCRNSQIRSRSSKNRFEKMLSVGTQKSHHCGGFFGTRCCLLWGRYALRAVRLVCHRWQGFKKFMTFQGSFLWKGSISYLIEIPVVLLMMVTIII